MKTLEKLFFEKEIRRIAKEVNIKDRYINNIFNKYHSLCLCDNKAKSNYLFIGIFKDEDGRKKREQIKVVKNYKKEAIEKLERLNKLFKAYKALKDLEELEDILFTEQPEEEALKPVAV